MKKSLLALAVLGAFAGAASAQSSVTLYGTVDMAMESFKSTLGSGVATKGKSMTTDRQGTSQVSVKGVEDLGGGMSAIFLVENDFDPTLANHTFANGEAYVGLSGGFGTIKLGAPNQPTLQSQAGPARQPFGTKLGGGFSAVNFGAVTSAAVSAANTVGSNSTPAGGGTLGTGHVRMSKSIMYSTPNMGGLVGHLAYGGEKVTNNGVSTNTVTIDLGVNYAAGPVNVWVTHLNSKIDSNKLTTFAGSYDLGVAKIMLGFHKEKAATATSLANNKGVNLAAVVPLSSNLNILANFAKQTDQSSNAVKKDHKMMAIGPQYLLSKRTSIYARYVQQKTDNAAATDVKKYNDVLLGVMHSF